MEPDMTYFNVQVSTYGTRIKQMEQNLEEQATGLEVPASATRVIRITPHIVNVAGMAVTYEATGTFTWSEQ